MRVLVTGGTGFVGLALAEQLIGSGHEVRLLAPTSPAHLLSDPKLAGAEVSIGDIRNASVLEKTLKGVDAVVHLAAITPDARRERNDPARIVEVNVGGTATLMQAAAQHAPGARILLISSVAIYGTGDPVGHLWDEARDKPAPTSLYGITKQASEQVATHLARLYDSDLLIARLGPIFGPWEHDSGQRALQSPQAQALALAKAGQEIILPRTLAGDWLYSRDAAIALAALLLADKPAFRLFNVGAGCTISVSDWCSAAVEHLLDLRWRLADEGHPANVHLTLPRDRAALGIDRLRNILPGPASRPLADCISDHLAWMHEHRQAIAPSRGDNNEPSDC